MKRHGWVGAIRQYRLHVLAKQARKDHTEYLSLLHGESTGLPCHDASDLAMELAQDYHIPRQCRLPGRGGYTHLRRD